MIQLLFKEGKSFSIFPLRAIYLEPKAQASRLQAAFSVSSKIFKKAVERNRIKRLMREAYRLQKKDLQMMLTEDQKNLCIFFIYTGNVLPVYENVFEKIGASIKFFIKIISSDN